MAGAHLPQGSFHSPRGGQNVGLAFLLDGRAKTGIAARILPAGSHS
jgi:hypothetical protein